MKQYEYKIKRIFVRDVPDVDLNCPNTVAEYIKTLVDWECEKEQVIAIFVNGRNIVTGHSVVSVGTLDCSNIHPREVFRPAIVKGSAAIILAHNHPSGSPLPSKADIEAHSRLKKAGEIIGISVLDHVIVCEDSFYSMKEHE